MDPLDPPSSSPRIMAAFEMLVERLSNLEAEARAQRRASELRDDLSGPGMLAGILDADGERPFALFKGFSGKALGLVFVTSDSSGCSSFFGGEDVDLTRHRQTLAAAWGQEVAERAIAAEAAEGYDLARCEDVGCPGRHEYVYMAVQEAILLAGFPGVAERLVPNGIWLRLDKPTGVRDILRLLRAMAALLGQPGPDEFACDGEGHIKAFGVDYWGDGERFLMSVSDIDATWAKPEQLRHLRRLRGGWRRLRLDDRERIRREAKHRGSLAAELLDSYDIAELEEA